MNLQIPDRYVLLPLAVVIYCSLISLAAYAMDVSRLHEAARRGDIATVRTAIEKDPSKVNNTILRDLETPLMAAAGSESEIMEVINYLIEKDATTKAQQTDDETTAAQACALRGGIDVEGILKSPGGLGEE